MVSKNKPEPSIKSGRYTLEYAVKAIAKDTGESNDFILEKIRGAVADNSLTVYRPGSEIPYKSKICIRDWYEEAYWYDLNHWLESSLPLLDFRFPEPSTSSAKVKKGINEDSRWLGYARSRGKQLTKQYPHLNIRQIAFKVYRLMAEDGITGRGGKIPSEETIRRHALTGIKSDSAN